MGDRVTLTKAQRTFLTALAEHGRLSASTGNPPVMTLVKRGLMTFVSRSEDFSVMEITDLGRSALTEGAERG